MSNITQYIQNIRTAILARVVRNDIASALEDIDMRVEVLEKGGGGGESWTNADEVKY